MKRAFTLVELIVVVAIILILAAILAPAFTGHGHGSAKRSSCRANLKQIGLGLIQYVQDYDQRLPLAVHKGSRGWADDIFPHTKSWQLFHCPSVSNGTAQTSDYFINSRLSGKLWDKLPHPGVSILGGDGPADAPLSSFLSQFPPDAATNENSFARRHVDGGNYLFADGHVKWLKPEQIVPELSKKPFAPTFAVR